MAKKVALESSHQLIEIVDVDDILEVFAANPVTAGDLLAVELKGRTVYCDCVYFDYVEGDYNEGGVR